MARTLLSASVMVTSTPPEVLLVDGEPVAGLELPRHVVPAPLRARCVLASDQASLRAAMDGPVVAAVIDGRADPRAGERALGALRALPGGGDLPVVLLAAEGPRPAWSEADPRLDVVFPPHAVPALHARLRLLAGASGRVPGDGGEHTGRLRSA